MREKLLDILIDEPDYECLMIDVSHGKVHLHVASDRGGNQEMGRESGLNTKIHLAVDAHGIPIRVIATQGLASDCTQAGRLIEEIDAGHLIANKGYDTDGDF